MANFYLENRYSNSPFFMANPVLSFFPCTKVLSSKPPSFFVLEMLKVKSFWAHCVYRYYTFSHDLKTLFLNGMRAKNVHYGTLKYTHSRFYDINQESFRKDFWVFKTQLWLILAATKLMRIGGFQKYKVHLSSIKGFGIMACQSWYIS